MKTRYKEAHFICVIKAIKAIKEDPSLSVWSVAKIYGVNHVTLGRRLQGGHVLTRQYR